MNTTLESIGPERAKELLSSNNGNRPINEAHVLRLSAEMAAGSWKLNGETIKISASGKLLDGQHRLAAVVHSKKTIPFIVINGLPEDCVGTIDIGNRRTSGQWLMMNGYSNGNDLAGAVNWCLRYARGAVRDNIRVMPDQTLDYVKNHAYLGSLSTKVRRAYISTPMLNALTSLAAEKNRGLAVDFQRYLISNEGDQCQPFRWYLNRRIQDPEGKGRADEFIAYVIAWNAARKGETVSRPHIQSINHLRLL